MFLRLVAVCLLLNKIQGQSYQSSINTGGKPILRSDIEAPATPMSSSVKEVEPLWVAELRGRIEELVSKHGYEDAKPFIKKTVDETQKEHSVLLDVKVDRDGESEVLFQYAPKVALRTGGDLKLRTSLLSKLQEPAWLIGLKLYVKNLINRYGRQTLDHHLRPVIDSLEREEFIRITDIDVDTFGEILVKYHQLPRRRTRTPYIGRQNKEQLQRVTQMRVS